MSDLNKRTIIYLTFVIIGGCFLILYSFYELFSVSEAKMIGAVIYFIFLATVVQAMPVDLISGGGVSVGFVINYTAFLVLGLYPGILVTSVGTLLGPYIRLKSPAYKVLFNGSQLALTMWISGLIYYYLGGVTGVVDVEFFLPLIMGSLSYFFFNSLFFTLVVSFSEKVSLKSVWEQNVKWIFKNYLLLILMAVLMAWIYLRVGMIGLTFFVLPLLLARYVFKQYIEMRKFYRETIEALIRAIEAKDITTYGHSERVAKYAVAIARDMNLSEDKVEMIEYAALLHDTGKIGIDEAILNKPTRLSREEMKQIEKHPLIGAGIVSQVNFLEETQPFIKHHHEFYNGQGYPEGLKGEEIPLGARILSVPDAFDAMISKRPYRDPFEPEVAKSKLKECSGSQFDPEIVEIFISLLETQDLAEGIKENEEDYKPEFDLTEAEPSVGKY